MGLVWNPWSLPSQLVVVGALLMATFVFVTRPDRRQNRLLAAYLTLEAFTFLFLSVLSTWATTERIAYAIFGTGYLVWPWVMVAYLLLLSTLDTPLVRPLGTRPVRVVIVLGAAALSTLAVFAAHPEVFVYPWFGGIGTGGDTMLNRLLFAVALAVSLFALVAAVSFLRRTQPGSARRRQAKAFLAAFAVRDAGMILFAASAFGVGTAFGEGGFSTNDVVLLFVWPFSVSAMHLLLAWGILRTQIFDIDLKLKWTINRGTLAAVYIASFFVVSEIVAGFLSDRIGLVAGVLVTGVLVFAMAPLQRLADRVSDAAMPGVDDTQEYRTVRKRDVYTAALEGALTDGTISDRERDMLVRLQDQLGLSGTEARDLELDLVRPGAQAPTARTNRRLP